MKIQNFAVVFIIIIMPIAMLLSIYTGNLIEVENRQAMYDAILLNSTYDAVRAYQMNTLNDNYESEINTKVRDINASVNTFFNSLAAGFSSSALTKKELTDYVPAMLYTLYDGYYVYGTYDNVVSTSDKVSYSREGNVDNKQYGLKPYVYYSCEYNNGSDYDIVVNYTLDNYITVTGTYTSDTGEKNYIARSGYYVNYNNVDVKGAGTMVPDDFHNKTVTLYEGTENEVEIVPEELGENLITLDMYTKKTTDAMNQYDRENYKITQKDDATGNIKAKYYNYIIYNDVKYYLDKDLVHGDYTAEQPQREGSENLSFNSTYDGIPIFTLQNDKRIFISQSTLTELMGYLGVDNEKDIYSGDCFRDVNAYYYYYKAYIFSKEVEPALKKIDLGTTTVTDDETGESVDVIVSNLPYNESGKLAYYNDKGKEVKSGITGNVIKTDTYHTRYTNEKGIETHIKSKYDTSKVFDLSDTNNDPELISSSFNSHRMDVIISSIESSLITAIGNFRSYTGGNYEYRMPVLLETEWERICNNVTVVSFMQGLTIGNYKYYSNYSVVANTKVNEFIPKESIYVQAKSESDDYHNPRCTQYNASAPTSGAVVGYRNIDYDRKACTNLGDANRQNYYYYLHSTQGAYECAVGQNDNMYTTDELLKGTLTAEHEGKMPKVNTEIRRAYITALARERGNAYKTYSFLNNELQEKTALSGQVVYTVHRYYQRYDESKRRSNTKFL